MVQLTPAESESDGPSRNLMKRLDNRTKFCNKAALHEPYPPDKHTTLSSALRAVLLKSRRVYVLAGSGLEMISKIAQLPVYADGLYRMDKRVCCPTAAACTLGVAFTRHLCPDRTRISRH